MLLVVADAQPNGGLAARCADRLVDHDGEAVDVEVGLEAALELAREELEARLGTFEGVTACLQLLDVGDHGARVRAAGREGAALAPLAGRLAPLRELGDDVGATGQVGDEDPAPVADALGLDVLVRPRVLVDGRDMDAALVGEGAVADVGGPHVGRQVGALVDVAREALELGEPLWLRSAELECEVGDDADEVGVATALTVAVDRALDVRGAGLHGREGVGDGQLAVVVGMDADRDGAEGHHVPGGRLDALGQRTAVRVAQHDPLRSAREGGPQCGDGVVRVGGVAVEEVLGQVEHASPLRAQVGDGRLDHREVLRQGRPERVLDVVSPRLAEDGQHLGPGVEQGPQVGVVLGSGVLVPRAAEGGQLRVLEPHALHLVEEARVLGVRAGPSALDEVDAERIEALRYRDLVVLREVHVLTLRAVAQRRVVDLDPGGRGIGAHAVTSG